MAADLHELHSEGLHLHGLACAATELMKRVSATGPAAEGLDAVLTQLRDAARDHVDGLEHAATGTGKWSK